VRFNITQNDARKGKKAGILLGGKLFNAHVYHNAVYQTPTAGATPAAIRVISARGSGIKIRNNILYTRGGLPLVAAPAVGQAKLQLQGNDYFPGGDRFVIKWGSTTYASLRAWRSATGQEKLSSAATGFSVDPQWMAPGGGGTLKDPFALASLSAYKLEDASALIDAGLSLSSLFGTNIGPHDFYGIPVPSGRAPEVGASEKP
jgi:hypothetical protein